MLTGEPKAGARRPGVGGRQEENPTGRGGGGYLNTCNPSEFCIERARAAEKLAATLPPAWAEVVKLTGLDTFMRIWVILLTQTDSKNRVYVPVGKAFLREIRRELVIQCINAGLDNRAIIEVLETQLFEEISREHMVRFINEVRGQCRKNA